MGLGLPDFNINKELLKLAGASGQEVRNLAPPKSLKMAIIPTHEPSNPLLTTLLLNPESLTETKAANWIQHNVPGQSDPILQWISGSSRTVSFTARVTLDIVENFTVDSYGDSMVWKIEIEPELSNIGKITDSFNSAILSKLYNVSARVESPTTTFLDQGQPSADLSSSRWKQSIQPQLDFYRGLLVPRTGSLRNQLRTPPLVRLYMGHVLGNEKHSANQDFILASYSFNILQTTPQLLPTGADVTFTFIEYSNTSKSITPKETETVGRNPFSRVNSVNAALRFGSKPLSKAPRVLGNIGGFGPGAA
jgi:hypothetical protein